MNIKILVCYHKKDSLCKNNILTPIHCGRAIAKAKSKDGTISESEYQWLLENTIGDDTGDNISHLNREVNEMTAIYWAWKNYDKLGNPDYIGLCHYRRLFDFDSEGHFFKFQTPITSGYSTKKICNILKSADFIVSEPVIASDTLCDYLNAFQHVARLSDTNHPKLYQEAKKFAKDRLYYSKNMFVMSRDDFFAYCEEIFPVMFDVLNNPQRCELFLSHTKHPDEKAHALESRLTGYVMEFMSGLYFMQMMRNKKCIAINFTQPDRKQSIFKQVLSIGSKKIEGHRYRVITILGRTIKLKKTDK